MALDQSALTELLDALRSGGCCPQRAGDVELAIPKLRYASFPALLEPRRRIDRALWAVIMEAFVHGVSPQGRRPGGRARHRCRGVQEPGEPHLRRARPGGGRVAGAAPDHIEFPFVFLDATYVKAHEGARLVSKAIVVATGVAADGSRASG